MFQRKKACGRKKRQRSAANTELDGSSKGDSTTWGLEGVITAHWAKQSSANFLWRKEKVT